MKQSIYSNQLNINENKQIFLMMGLLLKTTNNIIFNNQASQQIINDQSRLKRIIGNNSNENSVKQMAVANIVCNKIIDKKSKKYSHQTNNLLTTKHQSNICWTFKQKIPPSNLLMDNQTKFSSIKYLNF